MTGELTSRSCMTGCHISTADCHEPGIIQRCVFVLLLLKLYVMARAVPFSSKISASPPTPHCGRLPISDDSQFTNGSSEMGHNSNVDAFWPSLHAS